MSQNFAHCILCPQIQGVWIPDATLAHFSPQSFWDWARFCEIRFCEMLPPHPRHPTSAGRGAAAGAHGDSRTLQHPLSLWRQHRCSFQLFPFPVLPNVRWMNPDLFGRLRSTASVAAKWVERALDELIFPPRSLCLSCCIPEAFVSP